MTDPICPECTQGKHRNCTLQAIDPATDELVECHCPAEAHPDGNGNEVWL